jgi:hypothetical protein
MGKEGTEEGMCVSRRSSSEFSLFQMIRLKLPTIFFNRGKVSVKRSTCHCYSFFIILLPQSLQTKQ